jgi:hypothetical protein
VGGEGNWCGWKIAEGVIGGGDGCSLGACLFVCMCVGVRYLEDRHSDDVWQS